MNKKSIYNVLNLILISIITMILLTGCSDDNQGKNASNESNAERMQVTATDNSGETQKNVTEIKKNATGTDEITIAEFSTKIYNKEEARQNNIRITCGKLNGTIIKKGEQFSFEGTVGKATTAERIYGSRYF